MDLPIEQSVAETAAKLREIPDIQVADITALLRYVTR